MEFLHAAADMWLYLIVKMPMYGYDTKHEAEHAIPYYKIRVAGIQAKTRRVLFERQ